MKWTIPCEFHWTIRFYDLRYQLVNKRTEILPLATSHIAIVHLCNHFNDVFAPLIFMPYFKSFKFYQNRPKISLFLQKLQNFQALRAPPPDPRNSSPIHCHRYGGPGSRSKNTFSEHLVTTRQQTTMEKGIITYKHNSRLKFSGFFAKLLAANYYA